jgi:TDG/mug DNA glycosylase family protein
MSSFGAMSTSESQSRINGFPPAVGNRPRVLILGSMPGVASLEAQEYYALPRNAFWPIMGELFGAHFDTPYSQRLDILTACHISLWDVLGSCVRPGSLDASIESRSVSANNFTQLFSEHPTIRQIFFNGQKAAEMYRRHVRPMLDAAAAGIPCSTLPSTSPAHASLPFGEKLAAWTVVRDAAGRV